MNYHEHIIFILVFTQNYILDHLFTSNGDMKIGCACICIAYLTSMSIGACCLFFVHTLVHICLIFFVEILPICWLLVDKIGNIETLSISNVITRMTIMRIRELEWISCEISFEKSIWTVWESAKLVWKLLERNAQRDNKHTMQKC